MGGKTSEGSDGTLIRNLSYGDGGTWPLQAGGMGSSLELLNSHPFQLTSKIMKISQRFQVTGGPVASFMVILVV